jgi:hypothetical protein
MVSQRGAVRKRTSRTIGWPELTAGVVWLTGKTP